MSSASTVAQFEFKMDLNAIALVECFCIIHIVLRTVRMFVESSNETKNFSTIQVLVVLMLDCFGLRNPGD